MDKLSPVNNLPRINMASLKEGIARDKKTQNGKIKYTCIYCDKTYTETDYSNGHVEGEIEIIDPGNN